MPFLICNFLCKYNTVLKFMILVLPHILYDTVNLDLKGIQGQRTVF